MYRSFVQQAVVNFFLFILLILQTAFASQEPAGPEPWDLNDTSYLGSLIRGFDKNPKGAYAFSLDYTLGNKQPNSHEKHILGAKNLPDCWFIKLKDKNYVSLLTIYPNVEKMLLRIISLNQTVVLWDWEYPDPIKALVFGFLKQAWLPFSAPDRIERHIQALIDKGALRIVSRRSCDFHEAMPLKNLAPGQDGLMVEASSKRVASQDRPYLGVRPEMYHLIHDYTEKLDPYHPHLLSAEDVLRAARNEVAYIMGIIEWIEELDPRGELLNKRQRLGALMDAGGNYTATWTPKHWGYHRDTNQVRDVHPRTQEWIERGQKVIDEITLKAHGHRPALKPYGSDEYDRRREIERVQKHLKTEPKYHFKRKWSSFDGKFQGKMSDAQFSTLINFLANERPTGLKSLSFEGIDVFTLYPQFTEVLHSLTGLESISFSKMTIADRHLQEIINLWFNSSTIKNVEFGKRLSLESTYTGEPLKRITMDALSAKIDLTTKELSFFRLATPSKAYKEVTAEELVVPQSEVNAFFEHILQPLATAQQQIHSLTFQGCALNFATYAMALNALRPSILNLDLFCFYRPRDFHYFLDYLRTHPMDLETIVFKSYQISDADATEFFKVLQGNKRLRKFVIETQKRDSDYLLKLLVDFLADNDTVTEFSTVDTVRNCTFEDLIKTSLTYNQTWTKLKRKLTEKDEVDAIDKELIEDYARSTHNLPFWQTKVERNLMEIKEINLELYNLIVSIRTRMLMNLESNFYIQSIPENPYAHETPRPPKNSLKI